jgi:hypothetical protein
VTAAGSDFFMSNSKVRLGLGLQRLHLVGLAPLFHAMAVLQAASAAPIEQFDALQLDALKKVAREFALLRRRFWFLRGLRLYRYNHRQI